MVIGTLAAYLFGTVWLCAQMNLTPVQGLMAGVIPYLPGDLVKIILAAAIENSIRQTVKQTASASL